MRKINVMDEILINKIAAGEVVERPLSVVKELVENSIDAKATRIEVKLKEAGLELIEISDNGIGMSKEDLEYCIKRHATSKLLTNEDLYRISTLGFRGEALPSIYAVSNLEIITSEDGVGGYSLTKKTDSEFELREVASNKGTQMRVKNLFYNTPVRYKHLSNPFYEVSIVIQYLNKLAIIHPEISFKLINDDSVVIDTPGYNNRLEIISQVYNKEIAKRMMNINIENEHFKLEMYASHPQDTRARKNNILLAINNRLVKNIIIEKKIVESYGKYLHTNQFPIVIALIEVSYDLIDVNIHPNKQQVKISLIDQLLKLIEKGIQTKLSEISYLSEPFEDEEKDFEEELKIIFPKDDSSEERTQATNFESTTKDKDYEEIGNYVQQEMNLNETETKLYTGKEEAEENIVEKHFLKNSQLNLAKLAYIGSFNNTYLIYENETSLILVDQHAAQERINYEKIYIKFKEHQFNIQEQLLPLTLELTTSEMELIKNKLDLTKEFGFTVEEFGENVLRVTQIDTFLATRPYLEEDLQMIIQLISENQEQTFSKFYEDVAIMMACKKSIKAKMEILSQEAKQLLEQLSECEEPYTCPHGRPIFIKFTIGQLEKMFKRAN